MYCCEQKQSYLFKLSDRAVWQKVNKMLKVMLVIVFIGSILVEESFGCEGVNKYAESIMTNQNSILVASKKFWDSQENAGECGDKQVYCDYFYTEFRAYIDSLEPFFSSKMSAFKTEKYAIFIIDNAK